MSASVFDQFRLHDKVAWVTGGTKGLGWVAADALAGAGANLVISSRHVDEAQRAALDLCGKHGRRGFGIAADATDPYEISAVVARAEEELGGIDILVNSAGITVRQPTIELSVDDWRRVIDVNLTGCFLSSKAVIPGMTRKRWGRVIHIASIFGLVGMPGRVGYVASKGAVTLLAKAQALEVAKAGVTVNAICPGPFATQMNKALLDDPKKYEELVARIPMGRWGELHEMAGAVLLLASNAGSYMTGLALPVDGGWTAE